MAATAKLLDQVVHLYGDLVFDLCQSVLWSPSNAQSAFRAVLKEVKKRHSENHFSVHERAWILRLACEHLQLVYGRMARRLTAPEQIKLDSGASAGSRLKHFESYFHRLHVEDQILLLLKDKYGLPYPEIATVLGAPEGSLKVRRQQALRALEEWIWDNASETERA